MTTRVILLSVLMAKYTFANRFDECIRPTDEVGTQFLDINNSDKQTAYLQENDISNYIDMGKIEKEFWVPWLLMVCSDDMRVYGLQLTLKLRDQDMKKLHEDQKEEWERIRNDMSGHGVHRMNVIGSETGKCHKIPISRNDDADKLLSLLVAVDETGVRTLNINL